MLTILIADTDIEQGACAAIRHQVFVVGQKVPVDREYDGLDEEAIHYIVFEDGVAIATARVRQYGDKAKIERVAVVSRARGRGVATQLMEQILADIRQDGQAVGVVLGSQTYITGLYAKLGFKETGPTYEDAGLPHIDMALDL
jgi:predicted GNAT family N-acyltransferase